MALKRANISHRKYAFCITEMETVCMMRKFIFKLICGAYHLNLVLEPCVVCLLFYVTCTLHLLYASDFQPHLLTCASSDVKMNDEVSVNLIKET